MLVKYILAIILVVQACCAFNAKRDLSPRITAGNDAQPGQFPYQVSIRWGVRPLISYRHICGGSIISENFVLTAGHCVLKVGSFKIAAGKHQLLKTEETEQVVDVVKTFVHEGYKGGVAQHDIALMKLKTPLTFNARVAPIKLPTQDRVQTGEAVLSGWGSTSTGLKPTLPTVLQTAVVPLVENDVCLAKLLSVKSLLGKKPELFPTQICSSAGDNENLSACSGDSGGPLAQNDNGESTQVGIVSWGTMPCGHGMPSVYTRVASYVDWVEKKMNA